MKPVNTINRKPAEMDPARHLDRTAERDLIITLAEMQIAHGKTCAWDVDREKHPSATRQVLDVGRCRHARAAERCVRRLRRRQLSHHPSSGPCALLVRMERWLMVAHGSDWWRSSRIGGDQAGFAAVPGVQQLRVGQAADQTRMDQAGKADARDVARTGEHAVEIPDRFLCLRKMIRQESTAVLL
jgi:hypothetical protein